MPTAGQLLQTNSIQLFFFFFFPSNSLRRQKCTLPTESCVLFYQLVRGSWASLWASGKTHRPQPPRQPHAESLIPPEALSETTLTRHQADTGRIAASPAQFLDQMLLAERVTDQQGKRACAGQPPLYPHRRWQGAPLGSSHHA